MIHIKNVQPGQIFHPFKSSSTYVCLEILGTTKKEDQYHPRKKITNVKMKVLSVNLNTMTVNEVKKEFPYSVVRGMMWETVPLKVDVLSNKDLIDKIFKNWK